VPSPSQLSYLGVAKEATRGTGVAPTAFLPVKTITPEDVVKYLPVEVLQGAFPKTYGEVKGLQNTTFEMAGPVYADAIGYSLMGILGDVTTTASRSVNDGVTTSGSTTVTSATAAFVAGDVGKSISATGIPTGAVISTRTSATAVVISSAATATGSGLTLTVGPPQWHVGNVLNSTTSGGQPTAHTLTDFYGLTGGTPARQYAGIQWHEVMLKFTAEGLLEHTSKGTGLVPSLQVAKPAQSFSTVLPTPSWTGLVTLGGTVQSLTADGDLTITRTMELIPALTGTNQYLQVWLGDIVVKGKLVAVVNDDTELTRMLTNTQPSLDLNFSQGTGATAQQVVLHMSKAAYLKAKPNRGKQWVAYDIEFEAVGNSTDVGSSGGFGVLTASLGNNLASGTFV
jgi:hypothetical protein